MLRNNGINRPHVGYGQQIINFIEKYGFAFKSVYSGCWWDIMISYSSWSRKIPSKQSKRLNIRGTILCTATCVKFLVLYCYHSDRIIIHNIPWRTCYWQSSKSILSTIKAQSQIQESFGFWSISWLDVPTKIIILWCCIKNNSLKLWKLFIKISCPRIWTQIWANLINICFFSCWTCSFCNYYIAGIILSYCLLI